MDSSKSEKVRELLNFSGFPFQHHCADKIAKLEGFQIATEFPYTYPGTNGPILGVHGAIDILAIASPSADRLICFVVECKKARKETKNWIFLKNKQQSPKWPTFVFTTTSEDKPMLGVTRSVAFPNLGYSQGTDYEYCINGFEADIALRNTNANQNEKIYNPLRQVVHGSRAFEVKFPKIVEGVEYFRNNPQAEYIYVPVVVTTANLFIADFPREKVADGEVSVGDLQLSDPKPWISYEFPLPDFLSYEFPRQSGTTHVEKRTVFIVNDAYIDEFFGKAVTVQGLSDIPAKN